jgi:hypothetical protein
MARLLHIACAIGAIACATGAVGALGLTPAAAQLFDSIFGAPRPPANVPGGRQPYPQYPQDDRYMDRGPQYQPQYPPEREPVYPPQANVPTNPPGGVQSQPLPPPPGVAAIGPPGQPTTPGAPDAQRPPVGAPPADAALQPGDEVVVEPPSQKIVNKSALFSGLDKITGRIINFDVAIGETVQFGALQVTPRACYTRPPTETANTDGFVEVSEVTLQGEVKRIFSGWMFAASPGLHAVEHPIYDVWLSDCNNPVVAAAPPVETAPAPPPPKPATPPAPKRALQQRPNTLAPR